MDTVLNLTNEEIRNLIILLRKGQFGMSLEQAEDVINPIVRKLAEMLKENQEVKDG